MRQISPSKTRSWSAKWSSSWMPRSAVTQVRKRAHLENKVSKSLVEITPYTDGNRLLAHGFELERVKGIEPSSSAWKAVALPLSYTRGQKQLHTKTGWPANGSR